jgi:predicted metal-binding membrane protein
VTGRPAIIETLLRHDRAIIATALALLTALAWLALLQGAGTGMSATAMTSGNSLRRA